MIFNAPITIGFNQFLSTNYGVVNNVHRIVTYIVFESNKKLKNVLIFVLKKVFNNLVQNNYLLNPQYLKYPL